MQHHTDSIKKTVVTILLLAGAALLCMAQGALPLAALFLLFWGITLLRIRRRQQEVLAQTQTASLRRTTGRRLIVK